MAEGQDKGSQSGGLRFRLPKLFAETEDETPNTNAPASGVAARTPATATPAAAPATRPAPAYSAPTAPMAASAVSDATVVPPVTTPTTPPPVPAVPTPGATPASAVPVTPSVLSQQLSESVAMLRAELQEMRDGMESMQRAMMEMSDREASQERVFNVLHTELNEYKNDFIYEHLKPVVRPLLFLFDSLQQFDEEVARHERVETEEKRHELSPHLVRENIQYFREQLVEALRICEVVPMDEPQGDFDPKLHKAVDVVPVAAAQDNTIQRVVRSGWYLNGQLLRPAEVVLGRKK